MDQLEKELAEAARVGDLDAVRRLVETRGVNPNSVTGWESSTPLNHACCAGNVDVVRYLTEEAGVDARIVDKVGKSALHVACLFRAGLPTVRYLVEQVGLSSEQRNADGNTALHSACWGYSPEDGLEILEIVRYLVENHGADVDARNRRGEIPLDTACVWDVPDELILYLLQKTKTCDSRHLALAWNHGGWKILEAAIRKYAAAGCCGIDGDVFEVNPIHSILEHFPLPSANAYEFCIKSLLSTRTPLLLDKKGRFPLHIALASSNTRVKSAQIISMLVDMEPKSVFARDPTTGLYPYERICVLDPTELGGGDSCAWLEVTYKLFRGDPTRFLQTRKLCCLKSGGGATRRRRRRRDG